MSAPLKPRQLKIARDPRNSNLLSIKSFESEKKFLRSSVGWMGQWSSEKAPDQLNSGRGKWKTLKRKEIFLVPAKQEAIDVKSKEEIYPWSASWENWETARRAREQYVFTPAWRQLCFMSQVCGFMFMIISFRRLFTLLCRMRNKLEQRKKCKIVSLTLKQSEQSRKNQKADSKNTYQYARYVVQVAFYNCETTRNRVFIKELICILCYNLILKEIFYWLFIKTPRLRLKQMIDCMHLMSVFLCERYSCRLAKRMRKME